MVALAREAAGDGGADIVSGTDDSDGSRVLLH
jgi:hypothetical protein